MNTKYEFLKKLIKKISSIISKKPYLFASIIAFLFSIFCCILFKTPFFILLFLIVLFLPQCCTILLSIINFIFKIFNNLDKIKKIIKLILYMVIFLILFELISIGISLHLSNMIPIHDPVSGSDTLLLFITMLISLGIMLFFSLIYNLIYIKYFYEKIAIEINDFILNVLVTILFTLIIGLQGTITEYLNLLFNSSYGIEFSSDLFNTYKISLESFVSIVFYWLFALTTCFQITHKFANKIIINNNEKK